MTPPRLVETFDCPTPTAARLGGKGASLCRLVRRGHRVPPGFIVTADAFLESCRALGIEDALGPLPERGDPGAHGARARERLAGGRIPQKVLRAIERAVPGLVSGSTGNVGLIVRSSATVEDGTAHSFAGIFESIPIAGADHLEPTIRAVWASAFSPRALSYFREIGLRQVPAMAVVVQRFLSAERSGVMFTTFDGRTLIEHVEGDCEKLVKGEVTPAQLWLDAAIPPAGGDGALAAPHVGELYRLARDLEELFGGPQDVEWVLYDQAVHLVQSRPITTSANSAVSQAAAPEGATPVLTGIPASAGWASGAVHLVFNIEDALALERGRVLVTPMTNPDMVVAMRNSAAIVTDVGGMICHAAIVSRELGLPCVVGTEHATTTLQPGESVTADGHAGHVYRGALAPATGSAARRPAEWGDLWNLWRAAAARHAGLVPVVSTARALGAMPDGIEAVVLAPDADLRADPSGLWADLDALPPAALDARLDAYFTGVGRQARLAGLRRVWVRPPDRLPAAALEAAVARIGPPLVLHSADPGAPTVALDPDGGLPPAPAAVPLGAAVLHLARPAPSALGGMAEARTAALDTIKFFGHEPGQRRGPMPGLDARRAWWALLPEYARFHHAFGTTEEHGDFTWLEVRPELVISALLKSLVQPGFEMVPRVLGFRDVGPMHIKWIRCRYHFRSDTFARVWQAIVRATWDPDFMADLMRRVRASYDQLGEVLALFPETDDQLRTLTPDRIVALITSWWPRWVEFFALCWFIQAQGDDIVYPFIGETVADNLRRLATVEAQFAWPGAAELVAPTTPVMSGAYMADVGRLRETLLAAGLATPDAALAALSRPEYAAVADGVREHLRKWHWMRDRDLLFEPWDTAARVIDTALKTEPHAPVPYEANLERQFLSLSLHADLAQGAGRAAGLGYAVRFLHDLNVERENHHVLWLKFSYPLRRVVLEIERRLVAVGSLEPGDVFFLQAPELIAAARALPAPLPADLVVRVKNRRRGFRHEARLEGVDPATLRAEDDYY